MATTHAQNNRASLLSGLRTGGVRSSSAAMPHTAAPGATFNINRYPSQHHTQGFVEEDEAQYLEFQSQHAGYANMNRGIPMTAAVDGPNFSQLMAQRGLNPNSVPFSPMMNQTNHAQSNAFQMQMLQLEMMKIQAAQAQAQQLQAEMYAQSQRQQQAQAARRPSVGYVPPATAGPHNNSFDLRSAALSAQMRRTSQVEQQVKAQLGVGAEDSVPMTAALGGRFGSRAMNAPAPMVRANSGEFINESAALPSTPNTTTVISGGTPLGTPSLNGKMVPNATSKSDSVSTWRRGGNNNSVLSGKLRPANPSVTITPPPNEPETQMSSTPTTTKSRPLPLRFSGATTQPLVAVAIDTSEEGEHDESSSSDSSNSSPSTPSSSTSHGAPPLSPREEASKKLYEGLGIGRPLSSNSMHQPEVPVVITVASHRMVSQPTRQPRGPPSGADELGPKNFATRIRRQAIDGLGFLMNSRERRELVEVF